MKLNNEKINLRPFDKAGDPQILGEWLTRNHVSKWWGDPEKRICECVNRPLYGDHAIISVGDEPVGYIRWRKITSKELNLIDGNEISDKTVDVDIFIGEESYLNCGIGPGALSELKEQLRLESSVSCLAIGTSQKNTRAIRAFRKVGFRPVKEIKSSEFGDVLVMVCDLEIG